MREGFSPVLGRDLGTESARAGAGDGAEVAGELLLAHADAGVRDGDGAGRLVGRDANGGFAGGRERGVGQRLEAAAIGGVGGVGHELAQEDLAVRVEGVHDEIEQAADLGAELVAFRRCGAFAHSDPRSRWAGICWPEAVISTDGGRRLLPAVLSRSVDLEDKHVSRVVVAARVGIHLVDRPITAFVRQLANTGVRPDAIQARVLPHTRDG